MRFVPDSEYSDLFKKGSELQRASRWAEAAEVWNSLASEYSANSEVWVNLSFCLINQNKKNEALDATANALNAAPNDQTALQHLAHLIPSIKHKLFPEESKPQENILPENAKVALCTILIG